MSSAIVVLLGLSSAVLYGAADFCGGLASKRAPMLAVTVTSQAVGFAILLAVVWLLPATPTWRDFAWGLAAGVGGGLGIALLYHALSIGKMGVVSPITAVLAAAIPVLVQTLRGERHGVLQTTGMLIALAAIVLISYSREESGEREISTRGVKEAIASGVAIGGFILCLALAHREAGLWPLVGARVSSIALLAGIGTVTRTPLLPRSGTWKIVAFAGAIDIIANVCYVLASHLGTIAVAAVLVALYPASTVVLARGVLKERLQLSQKIGVALALVGVALISG